MSSNHADDITLDALVAGLDPVDESTLASLSHTPAAQALYEEVIAVKPSTSAKGSRRRRLAWQGAAVLAVAAVVLAVLSVVNVFGPEGPSIVAKAMAALDPRENAILHVRIVGHETGAGGYSATWTEESWASTSAPYLRRDVQAFEGSPAVETVTDSSGFEQSYDAASNTIYAPPPNGAFHVEGGQPDPYRDMILEMLASGGAVVDGHETIDGRRVTRIVSTKDYGTAPDGTAYGTTYLVDAATSDPVEWRMTRDGGKVVNLRFEVYEYLPATAENLPLLDLAAQHPGAAVVSEPRN